MSWNNPTFFVCMYQISPDDYSTSPLTPCSRPIDEVNSWMSSVKGAMCKNTDYLLTEIQYDIHNYKFSSV